METSQAALLQWGTLADMQSRVVTCMSVDACLSCMTFVCPTPSMFHNELYNQPRRERPVDVALFQEAQMQSNLPLHEPLTALLRQQAQQAPPVAAPLGDTNQIAPLAKQGRH